jgi:hypothetical protein
MLLPNAGNAIVADSKIEEYLLSRTHQEGKEKAIVFFSRGFSLDRADELRQALKKLAMANPVSKSS